MTDRQLVLTVYENAKLRRVQGDNWAYAVEHSFRDKDNRLTIFLLLSTGDNPQEAWKKAWNHTQQTMLAHLEM